MIENDRKKGEEEFKNTLKVFERLNEIGVLDTYTGQEVVCGTIFHIAYASYILPTNDDQRQFDFGNKLQLEGVDLNHFVGTKSQNSITVKQFFFTPKALFEDRGIKTLHDWHEFSKSMLNC